MPRTVAWYYINKEQRLLKCARRITVHEFDLKIPCMVDFSSTSSFDCAADIILRKFVDDFRNQNVEIFSNCRFFINLQEIDNEEYGSKNSIINAKLGENFKSYLYVRCQSLEDMMIVKMLGLESE